MIKISPSKKSPSVPVVTPEPSVESTELNIEAVWTDSNSLVITFLCLISSPNNMPLVASSDSLYVPSRLISLKTFVGMINAELEALLSSFFHFNI